MIDECGAGRVHLSPGATLELRVGVGPLSASPWSRSSERRYRRWPMPADPLYPFYWLAPFPPVSSARVPLAIYAGRELVGRMVIGPDPAHLFRAWFGIQLHPLYVGQGIGSWALPWLCRYAFSEGYGRLCLHVSAVNARALALYHRLGFAPVSAHAAPVQWSFHSSQLPLTIRPPWSPSLLVSPLVGLYPHQLLYWRMERSLVVLS